MEPRARARDGIRHRLAARQLVDERCGRDERLEAADA
jgi:hypothetical protein